MSRSDTLNPQHVRAIKREIDLISRELQLSFYCTHKLHPVNNPIEYRDFAVNHRLWGRFMELCQVRVRLLT